MAAEKIPFNSTIKTVWDLLVHPREYTSGVLGYMRECRREHGNAHVRIGITGSGQKPYYRIFSTADDGQERIFGSFYDNRDPLENEFAETKNWSIQSMDFQQVEDFLAEKTGYTGKRPR